MTAVAVALLASCLALVLPWWSQGRFALEGGRQCAWVLLPWVALAGLPRRAAAPRASVVVALLLPVLALGAASDLASQRGAADVAATSSAGLGMVMLLAHAARVAGGSRAHAAAWCALVPGPAALALACGWGGWSGCSGAGAALPLGWAARAAAGHAAAPWAALAVACILLGSARRASGRAGSPR
jgi:hypothetical protein